MYQNYIMTIDFIILNIKWFIEQLKKDSSSSSSKWLFT